MNHSIKKQQQQKKNFKSHLYSLLIMEYPDRLCRIYLSFVQYHQLRQALGFGLVASRAHLWTLVPYLHRAVDVTVSFSQAPLSHTGAGRECGEICGSLGLWFCKATAAHKGVGGARESRVNAKEVIMID